MITEILNAELYVAMLRNGAANLNKNRQTVNNLNVFPVPDGDTGDNMYMTIVSGTRAVKENTETLGTVSEIIARGMLMGARGNSGVILSRIFSGISRGLSRQSTADVNLLARAFDESIADAYGAVSKPVEGTILSVYRDAVKTANGNVGGQSTVNSYFEDFLAELRASLARTPELLPVLKEAGVVDSGAAGLVYIVEGMKKALDGEKSDENEAVTPQEDAANDMDYDAFTEDSELTYGYCTEFLLRLQNKKCDIHAFSVDELTEYLNSIGSSVVSFADGSIVKVHVHTMTPGKVLSYAQRYGEFLKVKIENMNLQHNENDGFPERRPEEKTGKKTEEKPRLHKRYGIVAVAQGEGLIRTFEEAGCDAVVNGGQCMNPSTEAFLSAFESENCDFIIVFPNNSNVKLTAALAAELYRKTPVFVADTKSVGEGYAALSGVDFGEEDPEKLLSEINAVAKEVVTAYVSRATRNAEIDGVDIREDAFIGFTDERIYVCEKTPEDALKALSKAVSVNRYDVCMFIHGENVSGEKAEELFCHLTKENPLTELIKLDGKQPVYPYILVLT